MEALENRKGRHFGWYSSDNNEWTIVRSPKELGSWHPYGDYLISLKQKNKILKWIKTV